PVVGDLIRCWQYRHLLLPLRHCFQPELFLLCLLTGTVPGSGNCGGPATANAPGVAIKTAHSNASIRAPNVRSLISNSFRFSDPLRLAHTMLCRHTMPPANAQDVRLRRLSSAFSLPSGGEDFTNMVQFDCHSEQAFLT